jgi:putative peptide zinc metalloprotease protein
LLPALRQDLSLHDGPGAQDGAPTWVLHDPAANRFYALSWSAFEILSRWPLRDPAAVLAAVNHQTTLQVDEEDLSSLVEFLMQHNLLDADSPTDSARLHTAARAGKLSIPQWLLKNYLFLRVPLFRPAHVLERWAPWVAWAYDPRFWVGIGVTALVGICLASRQWGSFIGTFSQYKNFSGIVAVAAALTLAKVLHEFGHAFTAQRYGCRVSTMGVAFLVMLPVLYTDTNEAWKLADKNKRLKIAAAGVLAELALAAVATVVWSFLPDGPVRAGVFLLASTTWILTLAVNASPFMRFDGYFLLCDWLDMPNLHSRAFAMGRWWLRELLFGWDEPAPEQFKRGRRAFLVAFAWITWAYRLGLFLGIAYLVYDAVFKLLGIVLLFVELGWFIALPIYHELQAWWERRADLEWNPATIRSLVAAGVVLVLLFVPLERDVRAPAVLGADQSQVLFAVAAARVVAAPVVSGTAVKPGEVLVRLDSPDLLHKLAVAEVHVRSMRAQLDRQPFNDKLMQEGAALRQRWAAALADVAGLEAQVDQLTVRAPFAGHAVDVNESLVPGTWVALHEKLLQVTGSNDAKGEMLVRESDLSRLSPPQASAQKAIFVAERGERQRISCHLGAVDRINLSALDSPYLASTYGGAVRVQPDAAGALVPTETLFRARLNDCRTGAAPLQELRGTAHIVGDPMSVAGMLLRQGIYGIQRELGR